MSPDCGGAIIVNRRAAWLGALLICGLIAVFLFAIILVPGWLDPPLSAADLSTVMSTQARIQLQQAQSQLANDTRTSLLQAIGGLLVVVGAMATWRQVHISREGQITERLNRAVDQVGSPCVDVRIGGIYALERIARNSPGDRNSVQFILGAFVRNHASWPVGAADGPQHPTDAVDDLIPWLQARAPDVQAAMQVLGNLPPAREKRVLYLSRVDLRSVNLHDAQLTRVQMRHANLARAWMPRAQLDQADMMGTDLRRALLAEAHLARANLSNAYLQGADLRQADLSYADLRGANLHGALLDGAVLAAAQADSSTAWPAEFDVPRRRDLGIVENDKDNSKQPVATKT